jgi:hypothetical protein
MKADGFGATIVWTIEVSLRVRILEKNVKLQLSRLMGLNCFMLVASPTLGTKVIRAQFNLCKSRTPL